MTYPSYSSCTFSVHTERLLDSEGFISLDYLPAFMHEFMHYLQEVSHLSSIAGYCSFLGDVCKISEYYTNPRADKIKIPIPSEIVASLNIHNRRSWLIREGSTERTPFTWEKIDWRIDNVQYCGKELSCVVVKNKRGEEFKLGLYALNELHSIYAQKCIEETIKDQNPEIQFRYNQELWGELVGEEIFGLFPVNLSNQQRFCILDFCLDTLHPSETLFTFFDRARFMATNQDFQIEEIMKTIRHISSTESIAKHDFFNKIEISLLELASMFCMNSLDSLSKSITWYIKIIHTLKMVRDAEPAILIKALFDQKLLKSLLQKFPPPILILKKEDGEEIVQVGKDQIHDINFQSAISLNSLFHMYKVLTSNSLGNFNKLAKCLFFPQNDSSMGPCRVIKDDPDLEYSCSKSHWDTVNNISKKGKCCLMTEAYQSIGLLQCNFEINDELY